MQSDVATVKGVKGEMNQRITIGKSFSIAWDDTWYCIEVNGSTLYLTPTQYRICRTFLVASETRCSIGAGQFVILSYQSCNQLLNEMSLSRLKLTKHISVLNARITIFGLGLDLFQGGYILSFSSSSAQKLP